jgi:hypothetical protein
LNVGVYIPRSGTLSMIKPKSAICGTQNNDRLVLDFEGNTLNITNLASYTQRLISAAGRHAERYPTIARINAESIDYVLVGEYDTTTSLLSVFDADALEVWSGERIEASTTLISPVVTRREYEQSLLRGKPLPNGTRVR